MRSKKSIGIVVLAMVASWWLSLHDLILDPSGAPTNAGIQHLEGEIQHRPSRGIASTAATGQKLAGESQAPLRHESEHAHGHDPEHDHDFCMQKMMDPAMSQEHPPMDPQDLAELKEHIRHHMVEMERDADLFVYTDDGDKIARTDIIREFEQELRAFESVPKDQLITYED